MIVVRASMILALLLATLAAPAEPALSSLPASERSIDKLLAAETLERLLAGEEITHTLWGSRSLTLIPDISLTEQLRRELEALDITIGVEMLRLYTGSRADLDSADSRLEVYNILRSVSSMEGIEYYSVTRERMRTLFASSYVIDGPDSRNPVPDPLVAEIPARSVAYLFQEDLTFGKNVYRAEYLAGEFGFVLKSRNLTEMRYYFLPMVKPEDSLTVLMLLPRGRHILFYGVMAAHTPSFFGIERSREESFYNRLNALYGWFVRGVTSRLDGG